MSIEKIELYNLYNLSEPRVISELDMYFTLKVHGKFKTDDRLFSASLFKENYLRFYEYEKKDQRKVAEIDLQKDEIASINDLFYVNPSISFDHLELYVGVQNKSGNWDVLAYPLSDVLSSGFVDSLDTINYPSLDELSEYGRGLHVIEKNNKVHFQIYQNVHYSEYRSELEYTDEGVEYKGIMISRDKNVILHFIEMKKRAERERNSSLYQDNLKQFEHDLSFFIDSLSEKENKEKIKPLLQLVKDISKG